MKIEYKDINQIIPYEKNPRKINDKAIDAVAKSITQFGFKNPIVIDKNNVIVCGHTRVLAAKKLSLNEIPVIMADDLTQKQIKAFRLIDNKTSEFSEWDDELLQEELNFDFDFDMGDFDLKIDLKEDNILKNNEKVLENIYQIIVECKTEGEQEKCFNLLDEKGYKCRILSL